MHFSLTPYFSKATPDSGKLPRPSEGVKLFPWESTQPVTETRSDTWEGRIQERITSLPIITLTLNTSASNCCETTENKFLV